MKCKLTAVTLFLALCFLNLDRVKADAPAYIPLQGILENASGEVIDGEVNVLFSLYATQAGGQPLWTENQTLAVSSGLFVAYLGVASPLDLSLFQKQTNLWLGIQVAQDLEMERFYLGSAPFSAFAQYCGTVPDHAHNLGDMTGMLPSSSLPAGVPVGEQLCVGTEKVRGINDSGKLVCAADQTGAGAYTAGFGLELNGNAFSVDTGEIQVRINELCPEGQYIRQIGQNGSVICGVDQIGGGSTLLPGFGLELNGYTFNVDPTVIQRRVTGMCAPGNYVRQIAEDGSVVCDQDSSGTSYSAGFGLDLAGTTFSADTTKLQARVTGNCAPGGAIQSINQDGTVSCLTEQNNPALRFDSGWTAYPFRTGTIIDFGTEAQNPLVFGMVRGRSYLTGEVIAPSMQAATPHYAAAYVQQTSTAIGLNGRDHLLNINNLGDRNNHTIYGGEMRMTVFDRAPNYDSGWLACGGNNNTRLNHNLGVFPHFALVEVAQNSDGSGWRVPVMGAVNIDAWGNWRQTALVELDAGWASIRTHGSVAYFRDFSGTDQAPASGFCRLRLYNWAPDYDSGWVGISTSEGNRDKRFRHNLGAIPSLVMLYVAERSGGTGGWCLPAMGNYYYNGNYGVGIYSLDEKWAVIKGGQSAIASFVTPAGAGQSPTSGYVRFLAWR